MSEYHDYASNPTAPHDLRPDADLIARLKRPAVGASDDEAVAIVEQLDHDVIRAESDELLAARVEAFRSDGEVFQPAEHPVEVVLEYVDADVNRAHEALAAEQGREKPRKSLITKLNAVIDAAQVNTEPVVVPGGGASEAPASDAAPAVSDAGDGSHV